MELGTTLGLAGIIVAVVAIPLTYIWGRRSRRRPEINVVTDFDVLLNTAKASRTPLKISFQESDILGVSRTVVAVWNGRGDTVHSRDVVDGDPLRFEVEPGDAILQAEVIALSRSQCGFEINLDAGNKSIATVDFDFLDESDGFVAEILHQGSEAAMLRGTVRGARVVDRGSRIINRRLLGATFWRRFRATDDKLTTAVEVVIFPLFLATFVVLFLANLYWGPPQLVPVDGAQLATLSGQLEFCVARTAVGLQDRTVQIATAVALPGMLVMWLGLMRSKYRRPVPASIKPFASDVPAEPEGVGSDDLDLK